VIDGKVCAHLIERLSGLSYYPRDNVQAGKDLIGALMSAFTDAIAVSVVNHWVENYTEAPKPAQLRALITAENEKLKAQRRSENGPCAACGGTGFVVVGSGMYTGAKPCDCLSPTHHARPETTEYQEKEREFWKPHWKHDKQDVR
jgi:hypothetical protein